MNLLNEKNVSKKICTSKKQMIEPLNKRQYTRPKSWVQNYFFSEQTLLIRGVMDPIYITLVNQPTKKIGDKRERESTIVRQIRISHRGKWLRWRQWHWQSVTLSTFTLNSTTYILLLILQPTYLSNAIITLYDKIRKKCQIPRSTMYLSTYLVKSQP